MFSRVGLQAGDSVFCMIIWALTESRCALWWDFSHLFHSSCWFWKCYLMYNNIYFTNFSLSALIKLGKNWQVLCQGYFVLPWISLIHQTVWVLNSLFDQLELYPLRPRIRHTSVMPLFQEKLSVPKIWHHGRSFFLVMLRWSNKISFYIISRHYCVTEWSSGKCLFQKGLSTLLNAGHIHNTNYHSLGLHLRPVCRVSWRYKLLHIAVTFF
jgi:hypothetical protein